MIKPPKDRIQAKSAYKDGEENRMEYVQSIANKSRCPHNLQGTLWDARGWKRKKYKFHSKSIGL